MHQRGAEKYTENVRRKLGMTKFLEDAKMVTMFDPEFTDPDTITGYDILLPLLETMTEKINIGFYTQNWFAYRFTPVNAYVDSTGRNLFFNTRQLWRPISDIEETCFHELVHVSDSINPKATYWHGDNSLKGKHNTAPVKFAQWAANWRE
jgi:hypothetical protein